jgi:hypothetical protein
MCGCGRSSTTGRAASPAARPARQTPDPAAFVRLQYRGARALLLRGPDAGVGYACYPGEVIRAHPRDAPHLIASGAFALAGSEGAA